jgi:hypothetical protein
LPVFFPSGFLGVNPRLPFLATFIERCQLFIERFHLLLLYQASPRDTCFFEHRLGD